MSDDRRKSLTPDEVAALTRSLKAHNKKRDTDIDEDEGSGGLDVSMILEALGGTVSLTETGDLELFFLKEGYNLEEGVIAFDHGPVERRVVARHSDVADAGVEVEQEAMTADALEDPYALESEYPAEAVRPGDDLYGKDTPTWTLAGVRHLTKASVGDGRSIQTRGVMGGQRPR